MKKELSDALLNLLKSVTGDESLTLEKITDDFINSKMDQPFHKRGCTEFKGKNGKWYRDYGGYTVEIILEDDEPLFKLDLA